MAIALAIAVVCLATAYFIVRVNAELDQLEADIEDEFAWLRRELRVHLLGEERER